MTLIGRTRPLAAATVRRRAGAYGSELVMIADVRAVSRRVRRVSRQLLNIVRGACLGLISPMMGDSRRALGPRVQARRRPRLQLMADSRVNDASYGSSRQSPRAPKR